MSLSVQRVVKHPGPVVALDGMAFEVPRGQVFGFLGANGAGKTTTMRIALGGPNADAGEISRHRPPGRGGVGFRGASGAGKTTTMRIALGVLNADAGEIRWNGTPSGSLARRTWG